MGDGTDKLVVIGAEIAREQKRLVELDSERLRTQARLEDPKARRTELNNAGRSACAGGTSTTSVLSQAAPMTPQAKLVLFRSLFRGRADVFPLRFVSKKAGKAGYATECANKFVPGVCGLPRIKCAECNSQAFRGVDDRQILNHLQGRHVMGVYPLLANETCWFLAADFDKASWREDVNAFRRACDAAGVPCAVERSQSGNGAHAWFFFQHPVPAKVAPAKWAATC